VGRQILHQRFELRAFIMVPNDFRHDPASFS